LTTAPDQFFAPGAVVQHVAGQDSQNRQSIHDQDPGIRSGIRDSGIRFGICHSAFVIDRIPKPSRPLESHLLRRFQGSDTGLKSLVTGAGGKAPEADYRSRPSTMPESARSGDDA